MAAEKLNLKIRFALSARKGQSMNQLFSRGEKIAFMVSMRSKAF